jgi:hypothetical protein
MSITSHEKALMLRNDSVIVFLPLISFLTYLPTLYAISFKHMDDGWLSSIESYLGSHRYQQETMW